MSLRPARKATLQPVPDPGSDAPAAADDEIEILEVTGVNETERPLDAPPPLETLPLAPPPEAAAAAETDALSLALAEAVRDRDQKNELWLRAQADLDNLRKRTGREASERRLTDAINLCRRLLPVLDNLERALGASADRPDPLRDGVVLIHHQLVEALGREGLAPVVSIGAAFDPTRHEAVDMVVVPGREPGTIVEEMQKGYTMQDRLVRPALVRVVAAAPADAARGATG